MLFDLRGKRKRFIQVVYAILALLFAVSFVGFGIGSDAAGGIFDALGFGSGSSSSNPQFEEQIDDAEAKLAQDPKDTEALEELVRVRYQAGNDELEVDEETQAISLTPEAETQFNASISAWERYLDQAKKPSEDVAAIANQAYGLMLQFADPENVSTLAEKAVPPAELVAKSNPGVGTYATLAQYAYFAGETKTGDEATKKAVREADPSQREQLEQDLGAAKKASAQLEKELERQAKQGGEGEAFSNPLQGLGGAPPGDPTAPPAP
jgi:hypothetical protein